MSPAAIRHLISDTCHLAATADSDEAKGAKSSATGFSGRAMRISSSIAVNRWVVLHDGLDLLQLFPHELKGNSGVSLDAP